MLPQFEDEQWRKGEIFSLHGDTYFQQRAEDSPTVLHVVRLCRPEVYFQQNDKFRVVGYLPDESVHNRFSFAIVDVALRKRRNMAATKSDLREWFEKGVEQGATHMIVACDTFDYDDYPVYVMPGQDCYERFNEFDNRDMQKVMEVYDLHDDKEEQLSAHRVMRLP